MDEAFIPPTASTYARTPQDMQFVREALADWKPALLRALYIGPAFGEDFVSWIPVGWGTGTEVQWTALELDPTAAAAVAQHSGVPVEVLEGDFRRGIPAGFALIVANHVWTHSPAENIRGLELLLRARPALLIAHDHKCSAAVLGELLTRHGYRLLRYNADQQPRASNTWPFLFARRSLPWVGI